MDLVLSIFHGADLFGRGFEQEGFCVVRAAELELGFDIRNFKPAPHKFDGIIAGSPCQDFSLARRSIPPTGNGLEMIQEFKRVVTEAAPKWFLLENVPTVPDIVIDGYKIQRFDLNARECGLKQNRLRHFQFGRKNDLELWIKRFDVESQFEPCCMASEGKRRQRRSFADFCELQGLPRDFRLQLLSIEKNYHVVGNGVPVPMGRMIARSIKEYTEICAAGQSHFTSRTVTVLPSGTSHFEPVESQNFSADVSQKKGAESHFPLKESQKPLVKSHKICDRSVTLCKCGCGRPVTGRQKSASAACRKRLERKFKPERVTV